MRIFRKLFLGSAGSIVMLVAAKALAQVPICAIQGPGTSSPYDGQVVTTEGLVTAIFSGPGTLQGFFIQDPSSCDADPLTSEGLFVYEPNASGFFAGEYVSVTGTVQEFQSLTELYDVTNISVIPVAPSTSPVMLSFPLPSSGYLERYEGMMVRVPGTMVVTNNDEWAHYGELVMSAPDRIWQPTHNVDPSDADPEGTTVGGFSNVPAVNAQAAENVLSTIILDDGRTTSWPDPPPLISSQGTLRCGSQVFDLTGVLHYMYDAYRVQPIAPIPIVHDPRPAPRLPDAEMRVVAWNVHNYWSTLGGFGAENSGELERQRTKLIAAMLLMDADALVLCELENNDVAWVDLLAGLNDAFGSGAYAGIEDDEGFGTKSVIFYRTASLAPVTPLYTYFSNTFERAHITQGFEVLANGARFLLSGVHLRSKLCDNATGANQDLGDGQGCYNARRMDQAVELVWHWEDVRVATGIYAQLIMGDFNAYLEEDPIDRLRSQGLTVLVSDGGHNYTYGYNGAFGAIDHAFGTEAMADAVTGAEPWAINADEPPDFDYPDANIEFYQPDAYRSSDHDPVVVGIDPSQLVVGVEELARTGDVRFTFDAHSSSGRWISDTPFTLELLDMAGRPVLLASEKAIDRTLDLSDLPAGAYAWRCSANGGLLANGHFVK